jgi:FtsP/CotA-like multicopper oxidase with cupredoxin domain
LKFHLLTNLRYHAHSELQRADGMYGGLVIHKPTRSGISEKAIFDYNDDLGLLIGDWYHRSSQKVQDYYTDFVNAGNEVRNKTRSSHAALC